MSGSGNSVSTASNATAQDIQLEFVLRIVECSLGVAGMLLNLATILVVSKSKGSLKAQIKLLLSLCLSDVIVAALHIVFPFFTFESMWFFETSSKTWDGGGFYLASFICSDMYFIAQCAGLATMMSLAVDLLIAAIKPSDYGQLMSSKITNILIIFVWIVPTVLVFSMRLVKLSNREYDPTPDKATKFYLIYVVQNYIFYGAFCLISNLSFVAFLVIFLIIYCTIRRREATTPDNELFEQFDLVKASVTVVIIIITYIVCLMPTTWMLLSCYLLSADMAKSTQMIHLVRPLFVCNTVCDPIIALRVPDIRKKYAQLLCRKQRSCDYDEDSGPATANINCVL